jgi:AsmA protein
MRTGRILAGLVAGIIGLCLAALLAVWVLVNPNDYKGRLTAAVKQSTGRELTLTGDIKLAIFPWVALELGPSSLQNSPGFGGEPFLTFQHASLRVRLCPLLAKRLHIDRVEIDGLDLRLRKNAEGVGNWQNFGRVREPEAKDRGETVMGERVSSGAASGEGVSGETARGPLSQLSGLRVTHGRVSYEGLSAEKFTLEAGAVGGPGPTPININFNANRGVPGELINVNAKFDLSPDPQSQQWRIAAVTVSGLFGRPGSARPTHWEATAPAIDVDRKAQALAVPAFALSYSSARLTGTLQAWNLLHDAGVTGSVTLAPLVLREFAPSLGIVVPKTRDPRAFAQVSGSSHFSVGADGVRLEEMQVQLDDTHFKGSMALTAAPRALKFDLSVDQIDLDRYLGSEGSAAVEPKAPAPLAGAADSAANDKSLDAEGTLSVGSLQHANMNFTSVRVTLTSTEGVVHLFPWQAQIDGGHYSGDITLNRRGPTLRVSVDEHITGIDMTRLLASTSGRGRLSGHGNMALKATAQGADANAMLQTLNGHVDAYVTEGALEGMDAGYELARAQALIDRKPAPQRENTRRTAFDALKMSADIVNGIATTSDLAISSQALRVSGQGSANLSSKALDFRLLASILNSPTSTLVDIPFKVTGTYVDPTVRPDFDALARGQFKQKLQDVLKKNGLEGLFGK